MFSKILAMSTNEQTPLSQPTSAVRNTLGKEQAPQNLVRPIIAEKLHQEKAHQEKLKAVNPRQNFKEASRYFESETSSRGRNPKERLGPRIARTRSESPEPRRGRSKSPREKDPKRRTMFKRLEKGVFHRLGDKEKNVSAHSKGSERKLYYSSRKDTESCYQMSVSERSEGGHWKSKPKKQKSSMEDDLSQPWVCEETDPFNPQIYYFDFPKTRMPSHIKTYDRSEDHLKIFHAAAKTERWAMPTWCHMFNSTLTGNARGEMVASNREWKKSFPSWKQEIRQKQNFKRGNFRNEQRMERKHDRSTLLTKTPREILALDKGKFKPPPPMTTSAYRRNAKAWKTLTFDQGVKAKPQERSGKDSNEWGNLEERQTAGNINGATMAKDSKAKDHSNFLPGIKPGVPRSAINQVREEKIQVAIHLEHPEQTVAIGSTLTEEGRKELCGLLRRHLDVFAWKSANMTGVPRHIAEHRLNVREGCLPLRQRKRGQAPERNMTTVVECA
nr:reverse transcriptase domain-containing protein [Tanacetum cinerariifolium]